MHEAFRTGLRRMFDTRAFGNGYPYWVPEARTFREIIEITFHEGAPDFIMPAYNLTARFEELKFFFDGLQDVNIPKAIVLSDFWNITKNYFNEYLDWVDYYGITHILSYYPRPLELFAHTRHCDKFFVMIPCIDPEIMNDWKVEKTHDIGFFGAGVSEFHPFYPERNAIHRKLMKKKGFRYLWATHPGYTNLKDNPIVGIGFSRAINACRISITSGGIYSNPFGKYPEILASKSMLMAFEPEGADLLHLKDGYNYVKITEEDALDKIDYYLAQPELCDEIAQNGYQTAMRYHTCYARALNFQQIANPASVNVYTGISCSRSGKSIVMTPQIPNQFAPELEPFSSVNTFIDTELFKLLHDQESFYKHLPIICAIAIGMRAQAIINLGIGSSTKALRFAAKATGGTVYSCDTDKNGFDNYFPYKDKHWNLTFRDRKSFLKSFEGPLYFVMYNAVHDYLQLKEDLEIILPKMRTFGIICIHDTQHRGIWRKLLYEIKDVLKNWKISYTSLPFCCGLTIIRVEEGNYPYIRGGDFLQEEKALNTQIIGQPLRYSEIPGMSKHTIKMKEIEALVESVNIALCHKNILAAKRALQLFIELCPDFEPGLQFLKVIESKIQDSTNSFDLTRDSLLEKQSISILIYYDVEGWAWWHRGQQIKRNLPQDIIVDLLQMNQPFNHHDYDFIIIFDPYLISRLVNVPAGKIIVGCSCPEYLQQTVKLVSSARCAAIFVNNRSMYNEASFSLPNLFCCQNGVDENLFQPAPSSPKELIACWVGNSTSVGMKGLDLITEACSRTNVRLIALDREANRDKDRLLTQKQVRDCVYHQASFYICASVQEGTPNPSLEALACGLPVISTRVGNMPEIIWDGYNGFLVDRSVEAIEEAIEKLKRLNRDELSHNARSSILAGWTWHQQAEKYVHMFKTMFKVRCNSPK
jgi:glycosyltransferase involved in cell wall biosynthesis